MGEGKTDVNVEASPESLEQEVEAIRGNVTQIASELDHRRHELFDWRLQLRKHASAIALAATAAALLVGGTIGWRTWHRRRNTRPLNKVRQLRLAFLRVVAHPERVARPQPSLGAKALSAAVTGTVGVLAKSLTQRIVPSTGERAEES